MTRKPGGFKLSLGSKFGRMFKGKYFVMEVVDDKGNLRFKVNGVMYSSPSAAASAVTNTSVNGWLFWGMSNKKNR
jgi:hypothetical protein